MLRTILVGSYSSVQGIFEHTLPDGRMVVRVGKRLFIGKSVIA